MKKNWLLLTFLLLSIIFFQSCSFSKPKITISCDEQNDLYRVLKENGIACNRFNTPAEAILNARDGSAVMILAEGYPIKAVELDSALYDEAKKKKLRLFVEFPSSIPGYKSNGIKETQWERAVISSNSFAPELEKNRILMIHDCHFIDIELDHPDIVIARARMLLPLAWLLRIEDTPQHRSWLHKLLTDLDQDSVTGTIPERIEADKNNFGAGHYQLPKTNDEIFSAVFKSVALNIPSLMGAGSAGLITAVGNTGHQMVMPAGVPGVLKPDGHKVGLLWYSHYENVRPPFGISHRNPV